MNKIILLGSKGFIGKNLLRNFLNDDYYIEGYSPPEIDLLSEDIFKKKILEINRGDSLIFASGITRLTENSFESMRKNIKMASNLSKFLEKNPVKQVIFLSTVDVYGAPNEILNENLLPNPQDYYSASKLISEIILKRSCSEKKLPLIILRLSGIYGFHDNEKSTMNKFVNSALNGEITILGDGTDKRDFVYVGDLYNLIKRVIDSTFTFNKTLNIATGKSYSINEIVTFLNNYINFKIRFVNLPGLGSKTQRIKDMIYDSSEFKKSFPDFQFQDIKEVLPLYAREHISKNTFGEINLLKKYPRIKRDPKKRAETKTYEDKIIARKFDKEYFDGNRNQGYGGFSYSPKFWTEVVKDMIQYYGLSNNSKVLDIGCAKGFMLYDFKKLLPGLEIKGIDISKYAIENSKKEVKPFLSVGNANNLKDFQDNEFDIVISINTLHNLPLLECKNALTEIQRIGKNAFISVDAWRNDKEKQLMQDWNLTALTFMHVDEWKKFFKEAGYHGDYYWFTP